MQPSFVLQELAIVIAAKNHNPTLLTPDFLKYSGIVPTEWELVRPPVYTNRVAQVTFKSGVSIIAEPNRVIFLEAVEDKESTAIHVPTIAKKYVEILSNVEYQAIGLNPRGHVSFENQPEATRKYFTETILAPGSWQQVGVAPVQATINLTYTLESRSLNLMVNEAVLRFPDEKTVPVVLFSGNFSYNIDGEAGKEKLSSLHQAIDNWQTDLETYQEIVNTKFLAMLPDRALGVQELLTSAA
ncbi:MAG: hypothetical protein F6K32_02585 [Desertifilum sp. SIO1I2]|nr:hypothetical protein [Desertifilum sp. SIO1I2]